MAGLCLLVGGLDDKLKQLIKVDENSKIASFTVEVKNFIEHEEIRATRVNQMSLVLFPNVTLGKSKVNNSAVKSDLLNAIRN